MIRASDTRIGPALISAATTNRVILCQARVFEVRGAIPDQSVFFVENATLQNPDIAAALGVDLVSCPIWMQPPISIQAEVPPIIPGDPDPDDNTTSDIIQ
jgi:hypothetical protein